MHWNVPLFKELLVGYHDQQLVQFIEFGWPITPEQLCKHQVSGLPHNQAGPGLNLAKLNKYLSEEISRGSVIGPFKENPLGEEVPFLTLRCYSQEGLQ